MTLRKGQKVRVSYEAEYAVNPFGDGWHSVRVVGRGDRVEMFCSVPPDATIEPIEDLLPGDVVLDADNCWFLRGEETAGRPWRGFGGQTWPDATAARPFKLHIRDGVVLS